MASILIIDDDRRVTEHLMQQLAAGGHECIVLHDGVQVFDTLKQRAFDLLVLDVMLPGASGFEICRRIRQDAHCYTMPIIFVSAMSAEEEVLHGLSQGADDYVAKPFDTSNLVMRIEHLLRSRGDGAAVDPVTSLPGADQTKRELQRRTIAHAAFALGYAELLGIREFAYRCGHDARLKAIRHFARALERVGIELKAADFFVGHMGGGHFVYMVPPERTNAYCAAVSKVWEKHLGEFYTSLGLPRPGASAEEAAGRPPAPPLDALFCVTLHNPKMAQTPQGLFETLSQIRSKAQNSKQGGVYLDQRV